MIVLCVAIIFFFLYYFYTRTFNYWALKKIPYDKPVFFFGSFYNLVVKQESLFDTLRNLYRKFSTPYAGIYIFHKPCLLIRSPELAKTILVKDFNKFVNRSVASNETADPIAFYNILLARDSIWRNLRVKLSPIFTSGKLKSMFPDMQECTNNLISFLRDNSGREIEINMMAKKYIIDIFATCVFGIKTQCLRNDADEFLTSTTKLFSFDSIARALSILCFWFLQEFVTIFKLTMADKSATDYLQGVLINTVREREQKKITRNDFMDLWIHLRKGEEIREDHTFDIDIKMVAQAIQFLITASGSVASTLSNFCYEISLNKEIQNRLRQEVTEIFQKDGSFTYENIKLMKYMDMAFKETLRKYPDPPFLVREASVDYTFEETGLTIEKDLPVYIPLAGLHYDPEYFPEPEKFDPERFDQNKVAPFIYMPFGEGPRSCTGQRFVDPAVKIGLASILKDFILEPTDKMTSPLKFDLKVIQL